MAIDQARDRADIVLVQAPPLDRPGATMPVARLCDGIIVVGRPRSIKAARARAIMDLLSATPTPILGIVLDPASGQATRASARERGGAPSRSAEHASIADELNSPTVEEVT
jgi:Mrp family chromosome partitioning ATPase